MTGCERQTVREARRGRLCHPGLQPLLTFSGHQGTDGHGGEMASGPQTSKMPPSERQGSAFLQHLQPPAGQGQVCLSLPYPELSSQKKRRRRRRFMHLFSTPEVTLHQVSRSMEESGRTQKAGESITSGHMGTVGLGRPSVQ